jgi:DNA-binding PadR family transcriptional regulator
MSVAFALLGLLEEDSPRHGYDLKQSYDTHFAGVWPVKFGQIYSTLSRLQRDELVTLEGERPGRGPERKLYAITDNGTRDLDTWLLSPEPAKPHVQSVLFMKVVLALLSDRPAERFLEAQREQHMERMRELTRIKSGGNTADVLLADYALFHLEADMRWIDAAQTRLERLRKEVLG